jgi:hypothetical protein
LTRAGAACAILVASAVFALGATVGRSERLSAPSAPGIAHVSAHHHEDPSLLGRRPAVFLLGPTGEHFLEIAKPIGARARSVWGRDHELSIYDDLFENPANPFERKPGDVLILLLTLAPDGRMPEKYEGLLPMPRSEIDAQLERGESIEQLATARDMNVLTLAAPTQEELETLLLHSERVRRIGIAPNIFAFLPRDVQETLLGELGEASAVTLRAHELEAYDDVFLDPTGTHFRRPGDGLVLLFSGDSKQAHVPPSYADLLPKPWTEIEAALSRGEDVELEGRARGMNVLVLAAPSTARLTELVRSSPLLRSREASQAEPTHEHAAPEPAQTKQRPPTCSSPTCSSWGGRISRCSSASSRTRRSGRSARPDALTTKRTTTKSSPRHRTDMTAPTET